MSSAVRSSPGGMLCWSFSASLVISRAVPRITSSICDRDIGSTPWSAAACSGRLWYRLSIASLGVRGSGRRLGGVPLDPAVCCVGRRSVSASDGTPAPAVSSCPPWCPPRTPWRCRVLTAHPTWAAAGRAFRDSAARLLAASAALSERSCDGRGSVRRVRRVQAASSSARDPEASLTTSMRCSKLSTVLGM